MLSGSIHDDLEASNLLGPMDAAALVQDTIAGGIVRLLDELPDIKLTVVWSCGNHSRVTKKMRVQTEHTNSLEWLIGHSVARYFAGNERVQFVRERAYLTYLEIGKWTIRFHHGHAIRYEGGIGGLTIPAAKAIDGWNKGRHADLDVFGHYHQLFFGPNFVANGSLIGYSPYAVKLKAAFQQPQQAFFLIDSKYGLTVRAPILLT
jgi:hypothetical protein